MLSIPEQDFRILRVKHVLDFYMRARSFAILMAAFVGAFALFATPTEAGGRHHRHCTVAITEVATGIIGRITGATAIIGHTTGAMGIIGHTMGAMVRPFTLPYHQFRSPLAVADTGNPTPDFGSVAERACLAMPANVAQPPAR